MNESNLRWDKKAEVDLQLKFGFAFSSTKMLEDVQQRRQHRPMDDREDMLRNRQRVKETGTTSKKKKKIQVIMYI